MNNSNTGPAAAPRFQTTTEKIAQLDRVVQLGKRVKSIDQAIIDYRDCARRRLAAMRAQRAEVAADLEAAIGTAGLSRLEMVET